MRRVVRTHGGDAYVQQKRQKVTKKQWIVILVVLASGALVFSATMPGITWLCALLALTAGASYIKRYTQTVPIDFEFLSVGSAYLAAHHNFGLALALTFGGTILGEHLQGGVGEFSWVKIVSVFVSAVAGALFVDGTASLFVAVLLGLAVQYLLMFIITQEAILNLLRRSTNAIFNSYIIFALLPLIS